MGFAIGTDQSDVVNTNYVSATLSVSSSEIEVKAGVSRLANRQVIIIHNPKGNQTVYYGPTGVTISTGIPIVAGETQSFPIGDSVAIYLIKSGSPQSVIIQELS